MLVFTVLWLYYWYIIFMFILRCCQVASGMLLSSFCDVRFLLRCCQVSWMLLGFFWDVGRFLLGCEVSSGMLLSSFWDARNVTVFCLQIWSSSESCWCSEIFKCYLLHGPYISNPLMIMSENNRNSFSPLILRLVNWNKEN